MKMPLSNFATASFSNDDENIYVAVWQQLMLCSKPLEQEISNRFRKQFNQSMVRYELLSQLEGGKWLSIGKVAQGLLSSNGNITKLVERMITEDLLSRRKDPNDRRIIEIGLTEKGANLLSEMAKAHASWTQSLMSTQEVQKEADQLQLLWQQVRHQHILPN